MAVQAVTDKIKSGQGKIVKSNTISVKFNMTTLQTQLLSDNSQQYMFLSLFPYVSLVSRKPVTMRSLLFLEAGNQPLLTEGHLCGERVTYQYPVKRIPEVSKNNQLKLGMLLMLHSC